MKIKIINKSTNPLPEYSTVNSAGMDIRADLKNPVVLKPMQRSLIPTGIFIQLPHGFEAQIRPRSGLAIKNGITVLNTPGTVDSDYRGEVGIILINLSDSDFEIKNGDRICQMIISKHESVDWERVDYLEESERGAGGFGHTGKS
jgi:dUTP pyrophosphatase